MRFTLSTANEPLRSMELQKQEKHKKTNRKAVYKEPKDEKFLFILDLKAIWIIDRRKALSRQ